MSRKEGLDLPDTVDLASVNAAEVAVIRLAAQGRIDTREALAFSRMLEHRRRAIGDATLEEKMNRLEKDEEP
jgi:hypothetical protein